MNRLVLWHGWGISTGAWNSLAEQLRPAFRPHLQPLPGYDGAPAPQPYTPETLVESLLAELPTPVTLCGWSMGALLAMLAAHKYPDKIERLILIGATPCFLQRDGWPYGMLPAALATFSHAIEHDALGVLKRFTALFNHNDANSRSIVRALAQTHLPPTQVLADGLALLRDIDLRAIVPEIHQPTLLLHGALDPLMPLPAAQWLQAKLPAARLEIFPLAAHAPFLSDPARCAALITDFMLQQK
ncbi:MAG: bioH [Burkholderiaceae bacterium]|nr:bioH [Burkholderiaceae bacterium]